MDAAGGTAGGGAGDVPDSAGFSLRQPGIATEIASKATDTVMWSRCALNVLLQIIRVHLSDGFQVWGWLQSYGEAELMAILKGVAARLTMAKRIGFGKPDQKSEIVAEARFEKRKPH
jgi:hypothetical protein